MKFNGEPIRSSEMKEKSKIEENEGILATQKYLENPDKLKNLDKAYDSIDPLIEKLTLQIKKLYELKLSILQEKNKKSTKFYLARKKKSEIKIVMMEYVKAYRLSFDKMPDWYESRDISYSIENFWATQRGFWNKAHDLEWSNNRDLEDHTMEYKH